MTLTELESVRHLEGTGGDVTGRFFPLPLGVSGASDGFDGLDGAQTFDQQGVLMRGRFKNRADAAL